MISRKLNIVQLYPREMNIYGDNGNVEVLRKRAELYGFAPEICEFEIGSDAKILREADLILGGGGQDSGQNLVAKDLQKNAKVLREIIANGMPMLMICGLYQLFGNFFRTQDGTEIAGIEVFDMETVAGEERLIGNILINTDFGEIVGYENHSGLTTLRENQMPFGAVVSGAGNNGRNKTEGARTNNCFGSYLHGPILPKNPAFADELLRLAISRKFNEEKLIPHDELAKKELEKLDEIAEQACKIAKKRPR